MTEFVPAPLEPPFPPGVYHRADLWASLVGGQSRLNAALKAAAAMGLPCGPRGGWRYAVVSEEAWERWAREFNVRARKRFEGHQAAEVRRALGGRPPPVVHALVEMARGYVTRCGARLRHHLMTRSSHRGGPVTCKRCLHMGATK